MSLTAGCRSVLEKESGGKSRSLYIAIGVGSIAADTGLDRRGTDDLALLWAISVGCMILPSWGSDDFLSIVIGAGDC